MNKFVVSFFALLASSLCFSQGAPITIIVSGGFGTCKNQLPLQMKSYLEPFAQRARAQGHRVQFIVSCFSELREDMQYFLLDGNSSPIRSGAIRGGRGFEQAFQAQFINGFLKSTIPPGSRVVVAGQSHGGWVALQVAASRPVDFVATLDEIDRSACTARTPLRTFRGLKRGLCSSAFASPGLMAGVSRGLSSSGGIGVNVFQSSSTIHSGPFGVPQIRDIDLGRGLPEYNRLFGKRGFAAAHRELAVDPAAWSQILPQLESKVLGAPNGAALVSRRARRQQGFSHF